MNCTEFKAAIAAAVEQRKTPGLNVAAHLDVCCDAECRERWHDACLLDRAIRQWRRTQPMIDAADAVLAQCRLHGNSGIAEPPPPQVRTSTDPRADSGAWSRSVGAITAAVAVFLAAWSLFPARDDRTTLPVAQRAPGSVDDRGDQSPAAPLTAGIVYVEYAQGAAQLVTDAVVLTLGNREDMEDPTIAPIGIGWEPAWPPVGDEMDAALDDLLESLPPAGPAI